MTNKGFSVTVIIVSLVVLIGAYYHAVYTADTVANAVGYFASLVLLPILIALVISLSIIKFTDSNFTKMQKSMLVLIPVILLIIVEIGFYLIMQYGGAH